jgi:hypothetical protein
MQPNQRPFFNDFQSQGYLEDLKYDWGCSWVTKNLARIRGLVPHTTIDAEGIVTRPNQSRGRLHSLKQIPVRQDTWAGGCCGPVLGFIDVAILERDEDDRPEFCYDRWAVAVIVRPSISRVERLIRDIEICRQGHISDKRIRFQGYGSVAAHVQELPVVVLTSSAEHQDAITNQRFIFFSCPDAFTRPTATTPLVSNT